MTETKTKKLTPDEATLEVYKLFCRGLTKNHIFEHAKANKWGLRERVLGDVIERAVARLKETAAVLNLDTEVGKALERLESLYEKADTDKDLKTALAVQKEINQLLGLGERARRVKSPPKPAAKPETGSVLKFKP